ncbi:DNA polymerase III subunit beta [Agrobacterium rubi]|uniref:nucleotidyltransferase family protein n=1 Tax=Agrobacterium rubi TaxID=28099 RepID=UPI001571D785|nr:nucleotidyltransferase domain-containing protein [Agrobacterium rubi]NTF06998.1 DNA polymerase III subunit beta [Agrobacterium rubi]NTF19239.1 DNA polymerase III subunit beta [Agrobacterium rubi]NTF26202.1 DNA polymerase III subunit beta [Agrobacterium rubi]
MEKAVAIEKLQQRTDAMKRMGATTLYMFGSTARDEALISSDLDLFIDYDPTKHFSLFDLVGIKQFLEEELSINVDVTTRTSLHPMLKSDIEQSAIRIF